MRRLRLQERQIELLLLAVRDAQVVLRLGDALAQSGPLECRDSHRVRADGFRLASPQVGDDAQVVGAAPDGGVIAVPAGAQ